MKKRIGWWCLLCLVFVQAQAQATDRRAAKKRPAPTVIESCVSTDKITFRKGDSGTLLDEVDRFQVASEIVRRYPMIERDGLYPTAIALWRRPGGDWVFATLMPVGVPAHAWCFTANVSVDDVAIAPLLLKKYFGITATPI
jgi:hypothetical protein